MRGIVIAKMIGLALFGAISSRGLGSTLRRAKKPAQAITTRRS